MSEAKNNQSIWEEQGGKVCVELVGSLNSCKKGQKKTASALGLFKRGDKREHTSNPSVKGQVRKIEHLLKVTKI